MAYTGGELNLVNGKYAISAPANSVPVMKLIRAHQPHSKEELYQLIRYHFEHDCPCGIKSTGTVEDFGKRLYDAQIKEWGFPKYSLQTCIQWEYDLFVTQSLKGNQLEKTARKALEEIVKTVALDVRYAEGFVDEELRVDLLILQNNDCICGIQVKPQTFNHMRAGVIFHNKKSNIKWGKPVFYLFYDPALKLVNIEQVVASILPLMESKNTKPSGEI